MKIATLEKIHELLKEEIRTRNNALELTRKAYNKRKDDLEEIAAAADDMKDESVTAAKRAVETSKALYDEEWRQSRDADAALRDFEDQDF